MNRVEGISHALNTRTDNQPLDWVILIGLFIFAFFLIGFLVQRRNLERQARERRLKRDQQTT